MIEALHPAWLAVVLPAVLTVWWLHRGQRPAAFPVSALFLWRGSPAGAAARARGTPDPSWRRRAAAAACLCIAAAGPRWSAPGAPGVEVWVDRSLSMQTLEPGGTRRELAFAALASALEETGTSQVALKPLDDHGAPLAQAGADARSPGSTPRHVVMRPALPAPARLADGRAWLVTDGADPAIADWLATAAVERVITVGARTENLALTRLAARRSAASPDSMVAMVETYNAGHGRSRRTLRIQMPDGRVERVRLDLAAGESAVHGFGFASGGARLRAALAPGDALAADDALVLDTRGLDPLPVRLEAGCPRVLRAALHVHPELDIGAAAPPVLIVRCRAEVTAGAPAGGAAVIEVAPGAPRPLVGTLTWAPGAARVPLPAEGLRKRDGEPGAGQVPVLRDTESALVAFAPGPPRRVWVGLDLGWPRLSGSAEYPGLMAALFDLALDQRLLERRLETGRQRIASHIAPRPLPSPRARPTASTRPAGGATDLAWAVIVCGCLLLLADAGRVLARG